MFEAEFRIIEARSTFVVAEPVDGAGAVKIWIPSARRYIENEIVILANLRRREGGLEGRVLASRRDPSFLRVRPLAVKEVEKGQFEFEEYPSDEEVEEFEEALEIYRAGHLEEAGELLRDFLQQWSLHIDSYHHLGNIDWKKGRLARAMKYYEMGFRIGLASLPNDFRGILSWSRLANRPFLRAAHAYALMLNKHKRTLEACKICEQLLKWDPSDRLGIDELLPRYYFEARAPELARILLEKRGPHGMNCYTLALCRLLEGKWREALRTLCEAVTYNPYVLLFLLRERRPPQIDADTDFVTMGGELEAAEYLADFGRYWHKEPCRRFVTTIMRPASPFRRRFDRFVHLKEQLEQACDFPAREHLLAEKQKILNPEDVRALLREVADSIFH